MSVRVLPLVSQQAVPALEWVSSAKLRQLVVELKAMEHADSNMKAIIFSQVHLLRGSRTARSSIVVNRQEIVAEPPCAPDVRSSRRT